MYLVNGTLAAQITNTVSLRLKFDGHNETVKFFLTNLGKYELILGRTWVKKHNPSVDWSKDTVSFNSIYCEENSFLPETYHTKMPKLEGSADTNMSKFNKARSGRPRKVGAEMFHTLSKQDGVQIFSLSLSEIDIRLQEMRDNMTISPSEIPETSSPEYTNLSPLVHDTYIASSSLDNIQIALQTKDRPDPKIKLPTYYHHHLPVFDHKNADLLPPHRECDHKIELQPGKTPPHGPLLDNS